MAVDKIYINMCWLREKVFDDGGSVINCAFNVEELPQQKLTTPFLVHGCVALEFAGHPNL